jgi:sulfite exporter TauE/SafE
MNYWPDITAAFVAGLFSSLHCIGMCGPLAALGCRSQSLKANSVGPLLFVLGKLGSYSVLGALAGLMGAVLIGSGVLGKATAWVSIAGGGLMLVALGISHLNTTFRGATSLTVYLSRLSLRAGNKAPLFLGMATAFLPCGLLYAMVARSAASGNMVGGMVMMQAFSLGTSPALLGIGSLLKMVPQKWSRFGAVAGEIVIALTAAALIWRGVHGLMATAAGPSCCH